MLVVVLLSGCDLNEKPKKLDMGTYTTGDTYTTYENTYFGFTLDIPVSWTLLNEEERQAILDNTSGEIDGVMTEEQYDYSKERTLYYVYGYKYPVEEAELTNAAFMCSSEQISKMSSAVNDIKNGGDYLEAIKELMSKAGLGYQIGEITTTQLGGREFYVFEATVDYGMGYVLTQRTYAALLDKDRFALAFMVMYFTEEEQEINAILDSIKFK